MPPAVKRHKDILVVDHVRMVDHSVARDGLDVNMIVGSLANCAFVAAQFPKGLPVMSVSALAQSLIPVALLTAIRTLFPSHLPNIF